MNSFEKNIIMKTKIKLYMIKFASFIIALCFGFTGFAQDSFIVENVRLFDGETVEEQMSVKIENGVVTKVKNGTIKGDFQRIDGTNKTLIPALTNAHVHAWMPNNLSEAAQAGVLNLLDMHGVEMAQGMMRQFKDSTSYANYYAAGSAATAPEGHGTQYGFPAPTLSKPEEAKQFIADRIKANADYIKIIVEPWKPTLSSETAAALIKESHNADKIAVVHVSRLEDAIDVISHDADGLVHIWWDKPILDSKLKSLSEATSFFVIPTLLTTIKIFETMGDKKNDFLSKAQLLSEVKKLYDAGIPILAGTDPPNAGINYGTDLYAEMQLLVEAGIPIIDAIKGATSLTADAFGMESSGYLRKGYKADMILIEGNPFEDIEAISQVETVWKLGQVVNRK